MTDTLTAVNIADIEARARKMRAEATRDGFLAIRRGIANAFAALTLRGAKAA